MMHYSIVEGSQEADMEVMRRGEEMRVKFVLFFGSPLS